MQNGWMRRALLTLASLLLVASFLVYRANDGCADWQEHYKRFLYSEIIKNSPFILTPEEIEEVIGERPAGCDRSQSLSEEDLDRYRREGVGPNEYLVEQRAA